MPRLYLLLLILCCSCSRSTYYIVRHAEKEGGMSMIATSLTTSDVPLSAAGMVRSEHLKIKLEREGIQHIYATNTIRARATAKPLGDAKNVDITNYKGIDSMFITELKRLKGGVLVVGHSNTVDDLVNGLTAKLILTDLHDTAYGDLFIIEKRGHRFTYSKDHFGK